MRLNKFLALYGGLSRRSADKAIEQASVGVNGRMAVLGQSVSDNDIVTLNGQKIIPKVETQTIMLNKPVGYVCSRAGQGSKTIYELLPEKFYGLKPVGRLDKDSSGLLLLTNDGDLANKLTHPRYQKTKVYQLKTNKPMDELAFAKLKAGVDLEDGLSKFDEVRRISGLEFRVSLKEGRNRQIRRTLATLNCEIASLHRISFGQYKLGQTIIGSFSIQAKTY